jgi:D-serine deaminase-like pyridoxal phosphate-dependent protein
VSGITRVRPGDLVLLVPEHVCTTVNLYREALWVSRGRLVGHGPVDAASRTTWLEGAPA